MSVQKYPWIISVYKGENRILIIPSIEHIGGYSVLSSWCINIEKGDDCIKVGTGILDAMEYINNSPISSLTSKELDADVAWKRNSKYKSWISFWNNNDNAKVIVYENGELDIYSTLRTEGRKGGYSGSIKKIVLPNADSP
ncbi:MAG: hypothetical protein IKL04_07310, partial [Lachnospiraceae bacterium]|nr:hypothetical protein [Lachnospiraceae bacterium]